MMGLGFVCVCACVGACWASTRATYGCVGGRKGI